MELKCSKCGNAWDYKGRSPFLATCPWCHYKNVIFIAENLKNAQILNCVKCQKPFHKRRKTQRFCSALCQRRAAAPKGGLATQEKHNIEGKNNPNWKGGISKNHYHYKKIQEQRYPERIKCRQTVIDAKRKGTLEVPSKCSSCGKATKPHAHHEDYSKPLDVIWLCRPCHRNLHNNRH